MTRISNNEVKIYRLPERAGDSLQAFRNTRSCTGTELQLSQAWLEEPESDYLPATVRVGWISDALLVYAVLQDKDIFNPLAEDHCPSFDRGDVFEMFFRPAGQKSYREFHVNPNHARLQLRIPSASAFQLAKEQASGIPGEWFMRDALFQSEVSTQPECSRWSVMACIPFNMICENEFPAIGTRWHFSFCRYDYTRGKESPVLSSTSAHAELNFHRQQEWGTLEFCERVS